LESAGNVYILESIGFIIAGPVITYILITRLNSFSIVLLVGFVNAISALFLLNSERESDNLTKFFSTIAAAMSVVLLLSLFGPAAKLQASSLKEQWKNQRLLRYQNSIYGNLAATKNLNQYTFYSNGIPIIVTPLPDIASIEDLAHFAMLSQHNPKNVLIIGGGAGGLLYEVLKYPAEKITYIELDPSLIKLVRDFPTDLTKKELGDKRLDIRYIDGRRFLKLTKSRYDVVIVNLPMPSTLELNRFYTMEFFKDVRLALAENGIFAFTLPGSLSYLSPELRNLNGSILAALKTVFSSAVIPGYANIYLASRTGIEISPELLSNRLAERGVATRVFNTAYLKERLNPDWLKWFNNSISDDKRIRKNLDLKPIGTYYSICYWNSLFSPRLNVILHLWERIDFILLLFIIAISAALIWMVNLFLGRPKRYAVGFAILTTGFTGMGLNLILIYAYQSFYGFVFHDIAMLVSVFMIGLAAGGLIMTRLLAKIKDDMGSFLGIEFYAICLSAIAGGSLYILNQYSVFRPAIFFYILSVAAGFLVGSEFPLANKIYLEGKDGRESGGTLYAIDLLGSWGAAILLSAALVPLVGIVQTCGLLAILKALSFGLVGSSSKHPE